MKEKEPKRRSNGAESVRTAEEEKDDAAEAEWMRGNEARGD
jgi:hypothetical protein